MKLFQIDDLRTLAGPRQWPCISLYLPTHKAGKDTREDPIRLRNALGGAKERLAEGGYPRERTQEVLAPAEDLLNSRDFWLHQGQGLAVFLGPDFFRYYRVPLPLKDDVIVSDHYSVKQLIPLFSEDGRFFVLALSQGEVRFFEGTRRSIQERDVPDMLKSIDDLKQYDAVEEHLQGHTMDMTARGRTDVKFHGQGNIADRAKYKAEVERYVQIVGRKLDKHLNGEKAPLVVAAVEYEQAFYRQAASYQNILEHGIDGNPDGWDEGQIHESAWEIVEPYFAESRRVSLTHFGDLSNTGKTSEAIEEILPAALNGRVRTMYLRTDVPVWGTFNPETGEVEVHESRQPGDSDLLDLATVYVLQNRGFLYALHSEDMPSDKPQAAMFRY